MQFRLAQLRARQAADAQLDPSAGEAGAAVRPVDVLHDDVDEVGELDRRRSIVGEVGRIRRARVSSDVGTIREIRRCSGGAFPRRTCPRPPWVRRAWGRGSVPNERNDQRTPAAGLLGAPENGPPSRAGPTDAQEELSLRGRSSPGTRRRYSGRRVHAHQLLVLHDGPTTTRGSSASRPYRSDAIAFNHATTVRPGASYPVSSRSVP